MKYIFQNIYNIILAAAFVGHVLALPTIVKILTTKLHKKVKP